MVTERLAKLFGVVRTRLKRLQDGARIYAVGDVHGHLDPLRRLHDAIGQDVLERPVAHATLLHIGDLIDRGPDSAGVLAHLAHGSPVPGTAMVNLLGNHEAMLLHALDTLDAEAAEHWAKHGGAAALSSWRVPAQAPVGDWAQHIPAAQFDVLRSLVPHWRADDYLFVHAGIRPGTALADQVPDDLLWIREGFLDWPGIMLPEAPDTIIVHGHTPRARPDMRVNRIGIDTGAGKGGPLSCAVLEGRHVRWLRAS